MEESELIDQYLRGELEGEQLDNFINMLQSNRELQKKVALRKLIIGGIEQVYTEELKNKLVDFDHSLENKNRYQFSWKIAAALVMLITAVSILYLTNQKPGAHDFDLVEPGLPNTMGLNNDIKFNNAMSDFKAGEYTTSGEAFNTLLSANTQSDTLLYFSGLCDFRTKHIASAIQKWDKIEMESSYYSHAVFRKAIAYWALGDKQKSVDLLRKTAKSENEVLREQSKKALETLN
jgi:hypothetical protein